MEIITQKKTQTNTKAYTQIETFTHICNVNTRIHNNNHKSHIKQKEERSQKKEINEKE